MIFNNFFSIILYPNLKYVNLDPRNPPPPRKKIHTKAPILTALQLALFSHSLFKVSAQVIGGIDAILSDTRSSKYLGKLEDLLVKFKIKLHIFNL